MGNSPSRSEENSISIIKTEGNQISGVSLIYNKEDEDKLLAKIQETLDTRTEAFGFNEPKLEPIKDLQEILEEKYEKEEEQQEEKKEIPEVKNLLRKIEETLATKTETFNSQEEEDKKEEEVELDPELEKMLYEPKKIYVPKFVQIPKVYNENEMKKILSSIEKKLAENSETYNSSE